MKPHQFPKKKVEKEISKKKDEPVKSRKKTEKNMNKM